MANKYTDAAFNAKGLTGTEKLVLWVICHRTDNDSGKCYPSYAKVASDACISRSAAIRAVKALIRRGLVSKCGVHGYKDGEQTNVFQVSLEELRESSDPQKGKDLASSVALPEELQNATGGAAHSNPPSCATQSEELLSAVGELRKPTQAHQVTLHLTRQITHHLTRQLTQSRWWIRLRFRHQI